jgi:hypothetical protein
MWRAQVGSAFDRARMAGDLIQVGKGSSALGAIHPPCVARGGLGSGDARKAGRIHACELVGTRAAA